MADATSGFVERLKLARDAAGFRSARELSLKAGFSGGYVSLLESGKRGKHPSDSMITRLAAALDVEGAWLTTGKGRGPRKIRRSKVAA